MAVGDEACRVVAFGAKTGDESLTEFTIYDLRHRLWSRARDLSELTSHSTIPGCRVNRIS